jgi:LmbE family N-acetylglucosaminyl deacetylase
MTGDPRGYYRGLDYQELRRDEARRAARILGIEALEFWDYPDGKLSEASNLSVRLLALLKKEQPDIVYRPSLDETHPDHRALASAFVEAAQRYRWSLIDYCYEVWGTVQPTHVIDISPVWERKAKAIGQYESQLRYNDYLYVFTGLSAYRTLFLVTAKHAEAYQEAKRR